MYEIIIRVLDFSLLCLSSLYIYIYIYIYIKYNIIALTHPKIDLAFV